MRNPLRKLIERLTHKHNDVKIAFKQVENEHERYSIRQYRCTICERTIWVDGRFDNR